MPAPDKLWWSTDSYLYKHLYEPLSKHLCIVSPNLITALSFLMTFPILYVLLEYKSLPLLLLLVFIRQSFDCMDGAVARACNACTKIGAHLDIWSDIIAASIFFTAIVFRLFCLNRDTDAWILSIGGGLIVVNMTMAAIKENNNTRVHNPYTNGLDKFLNNNTMVSMLLGIIFLSSVI